MWILAVWMLGRFKCLGGLNARKTTKRQYWCESLRGYKQLAKLQRKVFASHVIVISKNKRHVPLLYFVTPIIKIVATILAIDATLYQVVYSSCLIIIFTKVLHIKAGETHVFTWNLYSQWLIGDVVFGDAWWGVSTDFIQVLHTQMNSICKLYLNNSIDGNATFQGLNAGNWGWE